MAIKTPGSVKAQQGSGGPNVKTAGVRRGGSNQGKVSGGAKLNNNPRRMGQ